MRILDKLVGFIAVSYILIVLTVVIGDFLTAFLVIFFVLYGSVRIYQHWQKERFV